MPGKRVANSPYLRTQRSLKRCSKPGGSSLRTLVCNTLVGNKLRSWKPSKARATPSVPSPSLLSPAPAERRPRNEQLPSVSEGNTWTGISSTMPVSLHCSSFRKTFFLICRSSFVSFADPSWSQARTSGSRDGRILHACEKKLSATSACAEASSLNEPSVTVAFPTSRQISGSSGAKSKAPRSWRTPSCHLMNGSSLLLSLP
mmetsp:Transcript_109055/g.315075  ORF Transcript_109055/g.315075 Transcript_109055/m.315075 type:complete len:202 (-) Transcript_109055:216-821(-)